MTKVRFTNLLLTIMLIQVMNACQQPENVDVVSQSNGIKANFKGLEVILPQGVDSKILDYGIDDYGRITRGSARLGANDDTTPITEFLEVLEPIKAKYPNLTNMEEKEIEKALKYFTKLDKKGINENRETAMEFFEKLVANDLANELVKKRKKKSGARALGLRDTYNSYQELNSCEKDFLINHNRFADKVKYCRDKAFELERAKFSGTNTGATHGDAFRHAILTALLAKHGGENYGTVEKAAEIAYHFVFLHELCDPDQTVTESDHGMDYHNNAVGIQYFRQVGYRYKVYCFIVCNYNVTGPDDNVMADAIYSKTVSPALGLSVDPSVIRGFDLNTLVRLL